MCNYNDYKKLMDKCFDGGLYTDSYLNHVTEKIRQYLVNGGAGNIVNSLGIGLKRITSKWFMPELDEIVSWRFIWRETGKELTVDEIKSIGMFLNGGAFYGKSFEWR